MNKLTKQIQRTWKSAQLYIGFHVDPKGRKRKTPKVWPPKNASATLHDDPLKQEAFVGCCHVNWLTLKKPRF